MSDLSHLNANFHRGAAQMRRALAVSHLVIAGWTGCDKVALENHIIELERLGVKRPASTPIFYRVAATRVTTGDRIEVSGDASSGEVEFIILKSEGRLWIGVGSDHTDRQVETYNVTVSKQMCEKPIAGEFWAYEDLAAHWDKLMLRSYIQEQGKRVLYQEGSVAAMLPPESLLALWNGGVLEEGTLMFCGTLAAKGGIRPAPQFGFELEDPVLGRKLNAGYSVNSLDVVG
jgi:hypothetical protein